MLFKNFVLFEQEGMNVVAYLFWGEWYVYVVFCVFFTRYFPAFHKFEGKKKQILCYFVADCQNMTNFCFSFFAFIMVFNCI